jgi:hypothetical protein
MEQDPAEYGGEGAWGQMLTYGRSIEDEFAHVPATVTKLMPLVQYDCTTFLMIGMSFKLKE